MTNLLRVNPQTKHLNEIAHRHSFNESIYSEPYGGRYMAVNSNRMESNRPIPLSESASASNIYSGGGGSGSGGLAAAAAAAAAVPLTAHRTYPQYFFPQNYLSHRDMYGTTSSVALNGLSSEVSSTRSSVYSDKTILYESTPPSTPRPQSLCANEQTNKVTNPNKTSASNASGSQSQSNLQSKPINNTKINATATVAVPEKPHQTEPTSVEKSATKESNTEEDQSKQFFQSSLQQFDN